MVRIQSRCSSERKRALAPRSKGRARERPTELFRQFEYADSAANPTREWTAALHVYGGDFYSTPRTMWSGKTLEPLVLDTDLIEKTLSVAAAKARLADVQGERP